MKSRSRFFLQTAAGLLALSLAACTAAPAASEEKPAEASGTYAYHIGGYDWGGRVDEVTLTLDSPIDSVSKDTFQVKETVETDDEKTKENDLTVTEAYLTDDKGEKTDKASKYVTLKVKPELDRGNPLYFSGTTGYNTWADPYTLTFTVAEGQKLESAGNPLKSVTIDEKATGKTTAVDEYKEAEFKASDGITYDYGLYEPADKAKTLFVWLHGQGEGGSYTTKDATDLKVCELAGDASFFLGADFQEATGGANVLVPMCPTYWMDPDGTKEIGAECLDYGYRESAYTKSLVELIDKVKKETGSEKVVIAGYSNGGYMAMNLAMEEAGAYDAYVPIAEAMKNEYITDEDIKTMKDLPMYFIFASSDPTVDPDTYERPTIQRLLDAGAKDVTVYNPDKVLDKNGIKDENGDPVEYNGHFSWFDFVHNQAHDEGKQTVFDWIGEKVK